MKLTLLGVDENYPDYLKQKIIISNRISLIIAFLVALPFVFISLIFFPPIAYLPIVAIPIALSTLFFNYMRMHTVFRVIISLVPVCLASVYQAYLSRAGEAVNPGLAMIMLSFSMVIFVIFDLQEKTKIILMSIVMLIIMVSMDQMNNLLEMELETEVIETGFLAKMVIVISLISGVGCVLILVFQNKASETRAFTLLQQSEINQKEMEAKESHPEFLHPNLSKVTLRPWGAKEFALMDKQVGIRVQQW